MHITLYTVIGRTERVKETLIGKFAMMTKEVSAPSPADGGESFVIRLADSSEVAVTVSGGREFINRHISSMYGFFVGVKCRNKELHSSVLAQIRAFNCVAGISFGTTGNESRTNYILSVLFDTAKDINGLILTPDMCLFTGEGKMVLSPDGISNFDEYVPIGNSDYLGGAAEESPSDAARRERSAAVLKEKGIPYIPHLRSAVAESEAKLRTPEEIARRLLAMFGVCVYCEILGSGMAHKDTKEYLDRINNILGGGLDDSLSPEEKAYLAIEKPDQRSIAKFGWRYECCHVLMWALGMIELGYPDRLCDVRAMGGIIWGQESLNGFLEGAKPRSGKDVLDAADLVLRYDWACVDARLKKKGSPAGLNREVVVEWHYAMNWLIGAGGNAGWDDVRTDT
jgi:hypothetical protein